MEKVDKSLLEVWHWRTQIYEETKHLNMDEYIVELKKESNHFLKEAKLQLKEVNLRNKILV